MAILGRSHSQVRERPHASERPHTTERSHHNTSEITSRPETVTPRSQSIIIGEPTRGVATTCHESAMCRIYTELYDTYSSPHSRMPALPAVSARRQQVDSAWFAEVVLTPKHTSRKGKLERGWQEPKHDAHGSHSEAIDAAWWCQELERSALWHSCISLPADEGNVPSEVQLGQVLPYQANTRGHSRRLVTNFAVSGRLGVGVSSYLCAFRACCAYSWHGSCDTANTTGKKQQQKGCHDC